MKASSKIGIPCIGPIPYFRNSMSPNVAMAVLRKLYRWDQKMFLHHPVEKKISFTSHPIFPIQIIPQLAGGSHLRQGSNIGHQAQILSNIGETEGATYLILFVFGCWSKCEVYIIYKEYIKIRIQGNMLYFVKIQNPKGVRNLLVKRDQCERENHLWPQL